MQKWGIMISSQIPQLALAMGSPRPVDLTQQKAASGLVLL